MDDVAQTSTTQASTAQISAEETSLTPAASTVAAFAPNPMAIEFIDLTVEAETELVQPVDLFDSARHSGLLDRLEHELALVDAALSHIDDDDLDAADTAIKELVRHNDDGQVALPLR